MKGGKQEGSSASGTNRNPGELHQNLRRHGGSGLSYQDWLKSKDAEKRLKRKLIG